MSLLESTFAKDPTFAVAVPDYVRDRAVNPEKIYAMRCDGDCLVPLMEDGDGVVVDPSLKIEPGDLAVFFPKKGDKPTLKVIIGADDWTYKVYRLKPFGVLSIPIDRVEAIHRVIGIYGDRWGGKGAIQRVGKT